MNCARLEGTRNDNRRLAEIPLPMRRRERDATTSSSSAACGCFPPITMPPYIAFGPLCVPCASTAGEQIKPNPMGTARRIRRRAVPKPTKCTPVLLATIPSPIGSSETTNKGARPSGKRRAPGCATRSPSATYTQGLRASRRPTRPQSNPAASLLATRPGPGRHSPLAAHRSTTLRLAEPSALRLPSWR